MSEQKKEEVKVSGSVFDYQILKRLFQYSKPYRLQFYTIVVFTVSIALLSIAKPLVVQYAIDNYVQNKDKAGLLQMMMLLLGLLFIHGIISYLNTWIAGKLGQAVIRDLRNELFSHLLKFKISFFDHTPIGRVVTRVVSDIESLANIFSEGLAGIVSDLLLIVAILVIMFYTDWLLTLCSLGALPLLLFSTYVFKEKIKATFNKVRTAVANLNSFVQEHITGMTIVQVFNSQEREYKKFEVINKEHRNANLKSVLYYSVYFPVAEFIAAVSTALLLWYASHAATNHDISPGVITAFIMYLTMFFRPVRMIADRFNTIQMAVVSCDRVFKLLDDKQELATNGILKPGFLKGEIEFKNVNFSYLPDQPVLHNISFRVNPGQIVAFVGSTGAGKSTLTNILNGFYPVNSGEVKLDGKKLEDYDLHWLRNRIGTVLQDVFLFSDSIRNNITLRNPDITDEQIWRAIDLVGARKFVERLPGGLDYEVMERGATLSVGQRQLISFLRVLTGNADIVVLDEATASIDSETEELLQRAMEVLLNGRTCIVIAHRLSTIQKADCIYLLEKGRIAEKGNHESLLELNGKYAELCRMQYAFQRSSEFKA